MPINYKIKSLYDALKADGGDVGTEQEFSDWFQAKGEQGYKNRKSVYDAFKADGADVGNTYEEFRDWLGLKSKATPKVNTNPVNEVYSKRVEDIHNSPTNVPPNYKDQAQIARELGEKATIVQPKPTTQPTATQAQAPVEQGEQGQLPDNYGDGSMLMRQESSIPNMPWQRNKQTKDKETIASEWNEAKKAEQQAYEEPHKSNILAAINRVNEVEAERWKDRSNYDEKNFGGLFNDVVSPVFTSEKGKAGKEALANSPKLESGANPHEAMQAGAYGMIAREKFTDPQRVIDKTINKVRDDRQFTDYVIGRMGIDPNADNGQNDEDVPQLSEREMSYIMQLFNIESDEVSKKIQDGLMEEYKREMSPISTLDYIGSKAVHDNFVSTLVDALTRRAAKSSGLRQQLRQMAVEQYGKGQSWGTRAFAGAVPFAIDMVSGGFAVPNAVGSAVMRGGMKAAARQVEKKAVERAVRSGISEEVARKAATGVGERFLQTQAPILNVALRSMSGAANFATYDAQSEMVRQMGEGEFRPMDIIGRAVHGAMLGGAMGVVGGTIGQATRNASTIGKVAGDIGGVAAEVGLFATSGAIEQAMNDGTSIVDVDWAEQLGESAGMVLGMKGAGAMMHPKATAAQIISRYNNSGKYDLKLNRHNLEDLQQAGINLDNVFRGFGKMGEIVPFKSTEVVKGVEVLANPHEKADKAIGEEDRVDADAYNSIMRNPEISSDTKRKIHFLVTGELMRPEPIFCATITRNEDGTAQIETFNAKGERVDVRDYDSIEKADDEYGLIKAESQMNTINGLETISDRIDEATRRQGSGFVVVDGTARVSIIDAARGRTKEETGIDVEDVLSKPYEDRTQYEDEVIDEYIKNLQEEFAARNNERMMRLELAGAYNRGYEATEPEQMNKVKIQDDVRQENATTLEPDILKGLDEIPFATLQSIIDNGTPEQLHTALDYLRAKAAREGMIDRVRDEIDNEQAKVDEMIDERTNKTMGGLDAIVPVTMNDETKMYVIDGDPNRDNDLIAVDEEGKVGYIDRKDIKEIGEILNPQQEREEAKETIAQEISKREADKIDGVLSFMPNDTYQAINGKGEQYNIVVLQDNRNGFVVCSVTGIAEPITMSKEQIQKDVDNFRIEQVRKEEQERLAEFIPAEDYDYDGSTDISDYEPTEEYDYQGGTSADYEQPFDGVTPEEAQAEAEQYQANRPAMEKIPVLTDEKGNPILGKSGKPKYDWVSAPVETTAQALVDLNDGTLVDARDTAQSMRQQAETALTNARKLKVKGEDPIEQADSRREIKQAQEQAQKVVDYWKNVTTEINRRMSEESARLQAEAEARKTAEEKERERVEREKAEQEAQPISLADIQGVTDESESKPQEQQKIGEASIDGVSWGASKRNQKGTLKATLKDDVITFSIEGHPQKIKIQGSDWVTSEETTNQYGQVSTIGTTKDDLEDWGIGNDLPFTVTKIFKSQRDGKWYAEGYFLTNENTQNEKQDAVVELSSDFDINRVLEQEKATRNELYKNKLAKQPQPETTNETANETTAETPQQEQAETAKEKITQGRNERQEKENEIKRTAAHFPMETPEEAAAFDKRVPNMDDGELLSYMREDGNGNVNKAHHPSVYDEYDGRHGDEQLDAYDRYSQGLRENGTTIEQAEEMLASLQGDLSKFATDERPYLLGQEEALQEYINELEREERKREEAKKEEKKGETKKEESIKPQSESKQEQPTLQLTNEQEEKPKKPRTSASSKGKIEDVGEHLWGARKDIRKEIAMNLANITEKALIEKPFGKVYKKPDLKKAVESGALREKDAIFYEAFFSIINQQKPKSTQRDARMKRWSPSYKTKIEEWAETTYKALDTLRLFVEAEEAERDAVIEAATKDHYPNREQELAEIEKRKMWNPDRTYKDENGEEHIRKYEWGDKTTPNQLWITYEVMKRLGYNVGDKLDIPYGIIKANSSGTGYSIENLKGESNYKFGSNMSLEEAIDMIVYLARLKRGDSDISHPTQFFYFSPTKSEYGKSGRYRVMWGGGRLTNIKYNEFNSKEEADAFAAKKKSAVVSPIEEVKRRYGYRIGFSNPLTGDRFYVDEAEFDTKEEAKAHFDGNFEKINDTTNAKIDEERAKKGEKKQITADDVVRVSMVHTAENGWKHAVIIDAKYANNLGEPYVIRGGFENRKDAVEFANGIKDEVLQTVLKHKEEGKKIVYFDTGEDSRFGEDYRNGKDVTAEDFMNTFGFRGVQFGNWANQADRQMAINQAYDAFLDMAKLIGVSPRAMSLNGELGIAFGARGVGGFLAHYEGGDSVVINLTKTRGAGSLAHEWWHALDNYLSRMQGDKYDMVTDNRRIAIREELRRAFDNMLDMVSASDYAARSRGKGEYWGRMHEITARLLAEWVDRELKKRGELNTFLSRGANIEKMQRYNYDRYAVFERLAGREPVSFEDYKEKPESLRGIPYPSDKEIEQFGDAMRNIFDTIQEREDEETGNTILFREGEDEELQDEQIHSQSFKEWFGDWENDAENASKVVDENGRPLVVYRGADFNPLEQEEGKGVIKPMRYFTPDESYANRYGTTNAYYLNIRHPFDIRNKKDMEIYKSMFPDYYEVVKTKSGAMDWAEMGAIDWDEFMEAHPEYDGLIVDEGADPDASEQGYKHRGISYVPLHGGTQVKSATANSGAFSNESEDVRMRTTDTLPFYSNAARAVEQVKQDKATPEQWLKMIEKNGGLKSGEDKWIGLSDWLEASKAKSLTKQEVMDYIRENQIQIEETEYAENVDNSFDDEIIELWHYASGNNYDKAEEVNARMIEKYGEDFRKAAEVWYDGSLRVYDQALLARIKNGEDAESPINETRLSYTTQGLENKREIALTVPTIESWNTQDEIHFGDAGQGRAVAWVRFGETTDADGNRVLVIDEIQSKRHQEGRENGYISKEDKTLKKLTDEWSEASREANDYETSLQRKYKKTSITDADLTDDEQDKRRELWKLANNARDKMRTYTNEHPTATLNMNGDKVPSAPFEKNWHELAMKRMLRYAAENGYDKVAWTTGEQQAERYDLSKQVDAISYIKNDDGTYEVHITADGDSHLLERSRHTPADKLSDYLGKEIAQKIINGEGEPHPNKYLPDKILTGVDLKIGGEGMKGFYDEILPRFMNKYGKKWGATVGTVELPNVEESARTMWAVDVTPEMKDSVMQGQPMFRQLEEENDTENRDYPLTHGMTDTEKIAMLESQPKVKVYRAMQLIDGKLYPPMSAITDGKMREPSEIGKWEEADENPSMADTNGYFTLNKGNGKTLKARYNPYIHTSRTMLNDQFSEAQNRDNLVVVEMEVPISEINGDYKAEKAKDSVGAKQWKAGVIQGQLSGTREVILTRWAKPVRIVPVEEVAQNIFDQVNGQIPNMPSNVVTPQQRKALEDLGVEFVETDNKGKIKDGENAGKTWSSVYGKKAKGKQSRFDKIRQTAQSIIDKLGIGDRVTILENGNDLKGKKRKAKGWFDVKTGKIVIVLGNNKSEADVVKTILHEAVAHYGLRKLFGKNFDKFLDDVYNKASEDVRGRIDSLAERKHNGDKRVATEEYLASLAENTDFENAQNQGWWKKVKDLFSELLSKIGIDIAKFKDALTDNELRYILWSSYKNLTENGNRSIFDVAEDIVKQDDLKVGEFEREGENPIAPEQDAAYIKAVESGDMETARQMVMDAAKAAMPDTKIVDENGNPLVVYHGSDMPFNVFNKKKIGSRTDDGYTGKGFYFATNFRSANSYARGKKGVTRAFFVNVRNPLIVQGVNANESIIFGSKTLKEAKERVDSWKAFFKTKEVGQQFLDNLTQEQFDEINSHDGVWRQGTQENYGINEYFNEVVVPNPNQIKSADPVTYDDNGNIIPLSERFNEENEDNRFRDDEEEGEIDNYDAGRMTIEEGMINGLVDMANLHKERTQYIVDAIRYLKNQVAKVDRAMSLQRGYDKGNVDQVIRLAKIAMKLSGASGLTRNEVNNLIKQINEVSGMRVSGGDVAMQKNHEKIMATARNVLSLVTDHQLRALKGLLAKQLSTKAAKVNSSGVEVQGKLDIEGRRMFDAAKEGIKLSKESLDGRIEDALDRMGSDNEVERKNAAVEYQGLLLAKEYHDNIKASEDEEKDMKHEIRTEEEKIYDFERVPVYDDEGNPVVNQNGEQRTTERRRLKTEFVGDVTDENKQLRKDVRQFVEATKQAILENKMQRMDSYVHLLSTMGEGLKKSIERAKEFRERELANAQEIQHNANSDMQGRPSNEHYKPKFLDKVVNNSFVQFFAQPLMTFEQLLRVFGSKSANGEGYLYNRFMRGWVDARQKEIKGIREKYAILDAKAKEIFNGKVKDWGSLIRYAGKLPKVEVMFWDGGEKIAHELTQGNLMYIYMVNKMSDGKMKLRKMGISEEDVAEIEEMLDPRLKTLADWLQDEFLVNTRTEYNKTHERMFGASMASINDYFPLKVLKNDITDKAEDLDTTDLADTISTTTGAIIKRTRNALALDVTGADALHVILDHVAEMEHWNAFAEYKRDLNILRTYKRFRNQVYNMNTVYGSGKKLWKKFNDACRMAVGSYRPPRSEFDEAAVNFAKGVTAAKVSFRVFTALKQLASFPAYFPEARIDLLAKNLINPVKAWKWGLENMPIFDERLRSRIAGDPRLMKTDMDWKAWRSRVMQIASKIGMSPNAFVDALTVSMGAHAIYETKKRRYIKEGYSDRMAERKAIQDAEIAYNLTQQSSESAFLSTMQVDRSWLSVLFTVFRNASMSYQRQLHDALRNLKHNLNPSNYNERIEYMKKQYVRDGIDEEKAHENARSKFNRQLLKDTLRVATFGYVMQLAWNTFAYLPYLLFGDDDNEKEKMMDDVFTHTAFGSLEGLTGGDVLSQAGGMLLSGEGNPEYLDKDMPLTSDIANILKKIGNGESADAINDVILLAMQSAVGVNPQSILDAAISIADVCGGDMKLAHEAMLCAWRIMQVPKSQIDKLYFDEVGLSGKEVSNYTPQQLASRYAQYEVKRGRVISPWTWDDKEKERKLVKKADKIIKERVKGTMVSDVEDVFERTKEIHDEVKPIIKEQWKSISEDKVIAYHLYESANKTLDNLSKGYLQSETHTQAELYRRTIVDYRMAMADAMKASDKASRDKAIEKVKGVMDEFNETLKELNAEK